MTNRQKREIIREGVKYIFDLLRENDRITLRGFGTFKVVDRKARKIRNIRTGELITIPPYTTIKFKVSKMLRNYFPPVSPKITEYSEMPRKVELAIPKEELDRAMEEQDKYIKREEEKKAKEFRKMILSLGGIKDNDWESIPRWCRRNHGYTLGEVAQELSSIGTFGHFNEETLYEALWDHTLALR